MNRRIFLASVGSSLATAKSFSREESGFAPTRILDASVTFTAQRFTTPLQISSGSIESITEAMATVTVETGGQRAVGRGAIYLSDLWAWPDDSQSHEARDATLRRLCELIAAELPKRSKQPHHPLELGMRVHELAVELPAAPDPTVLARVMCASPFDAAIHDGAGAALGCSAFALYRHPAAIPTADTFFPAIGACRAVARVIQRPRSHLPAWYLVGKDLPLDSGFEKVIKQRGYGCFKLKLTGRDNHADVERTEEVYRAVAEFGVKAPRLTVDTNEANPSADSVLEYLQHLERKSGGAYAALEYLEQPTSRDIRRQSFDWSEVAKRKPVMLDEGLTDLTLLEDARRQGYCGLALKTCKGHSMLLASAAWAHQHKMLISLQDLTNPGIALIHGALVGAHLPTINGAELNSPQFTPAANTQFLPRLQDLFEPRDGVHRLPISIPAGLGSAL